MPPAITAEAIAESVYRAIAAHSASEGSAIRAAADTALLGEGGAVDSQGLVRLVMAVERQVEDDFGVPLSLTDEKAMSQWNSPFRTVGALTAYIGSCLGQP